MATRALSKGLVACLRNVVDYTLENPGAALKNAPKAVYDETLSFGNKTGAVTYGAANASLRWLRAPKFFYKSEPGREFGNAITKAHEDFTFKLADGLTFHTPLLKKVTPDASLIEKNALGRPIERVQDVYEQQTAERLDAFMTGNLSPEMLLPHELGPFSAMKRDIIELIAERREFGKRGFTLSDDVKTPTIRAAFDPEFPGMYENITIIPKELHTKIMQPDAVAGDFTVSDWFKVAYPQLLKKDAYDVALKVANKNLKQMTPTEIQYTELLTNRIKGHRTNAQRFMDHTIESARDQFGLPKLDFKPSVRFATFMSRNFYRGLLGGNPAAALLNLSQSVNTAAKFGPMLTMRGAAQYANGVFKGGTARKLVRDAEAALFQDFHEFFRQGQGALGSLDPFLYKMFDTAEHINRGIAFHTGLSAFLQRKGIKSLDEFASLKTGSRDSKLIFNEGMEAGVAASNDTQFLYSAVHQSPLLTTKFGKLFGGQFMSFPIHQTEFLIRNWQQDRWMFAGRWLALTGFAAGVANYGLGITLGSQLGGFGGLPLAYDIMQDGDNPDRVKQGLYTAFWGIPKFLPESFSISRGLTPMNGLLIDAVGAMSAINSGDVQAHDAIARFGRSFMNLAPMGLTIRRASEAYSAQANGERREPGSLDAGKLGTLLESTGVLPMINNVSRRWFGGQPIPFVGDRPSGRLSAKDEGLLENLKAGIGVRSVDRATESSRIDALREIDQTSGNVRGTFISQMTSAINNGDQDAFRQLIRPAMQSRAFLDSDDLKQTLVRSIVRSRETKEQRLRKGLPNVEKLKIILSDMEEEDQ